jgi:hypothetical membrane protein
VDPGTVALAAFCSAVVGLFIVHLLRPDYEVRSHMISDYAVGPHGWVMVAVFLAMSVGYFALALGFLQLGPRSWLARLGSVLLGIVSVGLVVSALFPTDLPGAKLTRTGGLHEISFLVNVGSSVVAVLLLGASFGRDLKWRSFRAPALALAGVILLALVIQFRTLHRGAPYGYANRFFVVALLAWLVSASTWLRAVGTGAQAAVAVGAE